MSLVVSNFSNGWIVEVVANGSTPCESWLLLPGENLWHEGVRGFLYLLAMIYIFLGIAIASDVFMCSIEVITSKKKTVVRWDEERHDRVEKEVLVWNETVANLTLMALGSSAPEILLSVIETCLNLTSDEESDGLGTFTIIGSAAFNLLIITAICIMSVPYPQIRRVREFGVFIMTSIWSIFAYVWMLIVVAVHSPGEIEIWEAWLTLAFFPIMVLMAYCQDSGWWCYKCHKSSSAVDATMQSQMNVRVISDKQNHSMIHGLSKELQALEREKQKSQCNLKAIDDGRVTDVDSISHDNQSSSAAPSPCFLLSASQPASGVPTPATSQPSTPRPPRHITRVSTTQKEGDSASQGSQTRLVTSPLPTNPTVQIVNRNIARARFRHAAVRSLMGGKRHHVAVSPAAVSAAQHKVKMSDVVDAVNKSSIVEGSTMSPEELIGKFTFASPSYSVLESAGIIEIDLLFHRRPPSKTTKIANGGGSLPGAGPPAKNGLTPVEKESETSFSDKDQHTGIVSIEYETREGSAKIDKDFKYTNGKLVFCESEYRKTVTIPIINDNQYEADVDFYVILKNPYGDSGIGDPSVTRVTIIDDDEPGEFQFEEPHYYSDLKSGLAAVTVIRQRGCDGNVTLEYSTIDGTARGGDHIGDGYDYIRTEGVLTFKHSETSSTINMQINRDAKGSKNFILTLRNPSLGAKVGEHSATVVNITTDDLADRLADVLDDDDENVTWAGQFRSAMSLGSEEDEEGNEVPLKWYDYLLHFLSFFWKVLFACIPPRCYWGAWPAFIMSLLFIGGLVALVEQFGTLAGCVIGIKASITGITIIAIGTSLPDTFASRTAALHDEYADAAIGNVTGSNSVNVFLGLGLPWVISSMYRLGRGTKLKVSTDNLVQSVVVFTVMGTICIVLLIIRRRVIGGELGGPNKTVKYLSGLFLIFLWVIYVILSALNAYMPELFRF